MTDYQIRKVVDTYFEILHIEGLPEKYVKDFFEDGGSVTVILVSGKAYSEEIKNYNVEAKRDV